jgi:hypothetical protein
VKIEPTCSTTVGCAGDKISAPSAATKPSMAMRPLSFSEKSVKPCGIDLSSGLSTIMRTVAADCLFATTAAGFVVDDVKDDVVRDAVGRVRTAGPVTKAAQLMFAWGVVDDEWYKADSGADSLDCDKM